MQIYQLETGVVADYATKELAKYVQMMCGNVAEVHYKHGKNGIALGLFSTLGVSFEGIEDPELDDAYEIKVDGFCGYIAGSNLRCILYGVYEYLKAAGCRFIRPGKDDEFIPEVNLSDFKTDFRAKAHHRFRGDCIEGAVSYEFVRDYVEWLPKIGFNGYLMQATSPYLWYAKWYEHHGNPNKQPTPLSVEEADIITHKLEMDIKRCGLMLHSVGHDYMSPAFDLYGSPTEEDVDRKGLRDYLALVKGKRKIVCGHFRYTNLCFSNPTVKRKIADFFVRYVTEKPQVDYLHIWLADSPNNNCECENCKKGNVSDHYIDILNDADQAFCEKGIKTKIVFTMYNDSCWAPISERLKNSDRFVFMPAARQDYISGYTNYDKKVELPEFVLNCNTIEKTNFPLNMSFFREWKKLYKGDTFFFDYHLYSDHYCDPGYCQISDRLMRDLKLLDNIGVNGYMHCSSPRKNTPTSYPMYMSGKILMNPTLTEAEISEEYYSAAFGKDWKKVYTYLRTLSELFHPDLVRNTALGAADEMFSKGPENTLPYMNNPEALKDFLKIGGVISDFEPVIAENIEHPNACVRKSWDILRVHAQIVRKIAEGMCAGAAGDMETAQNICRDIVKQLRDLEDDYVQDFDFYLLYRRLKVTFGFSTTVFSSVAQDI